MESVDGDIWRRRTIEHLVVNVVQPLGANFGARDLVTVMNYDRASPISSGARRTAHLEQVRRIRIPGLSRRIKAE